MADSDDLHSIAAADDVILENGRIVGVIENGFVHLFCDNE